ELGYGSRFEIYLPALTHHVEVTGSEQEDRSGHTGTETILVVEDDDMVRGFTVLALQNQGYRVLVANNGLTALEVVAHYKGRIDLLLTDLIMPKMGGQDL